jgi:hypothetical protein
MPIAPRSLAPRRPLSRRRVGRVAFGIAAVAAAAVATASPAHAASSNGCTISPLKPTISPFLNSSGQKVAIYSLKISCASPRRIEVTNQNAYEQDNGKVGDAGGDDFLGAWHWVWVWNANNWTKTFSPTLAVGNHDTDATVELFHNARFRVCTTDAGICGPWVQSENSPVLTGVAP